VLDRMLRHPVAPVPAGARIQPIHVDDVAAAVVAALFRDEALGPPIVIAGPQAASYRWHLKEVARARHRRVVTLPVPLVMLRLIGRLLGPSGHALRRLAEGKSFAIDEMRRRLGVEPRPFDPAA
jgi:nucleoside-diphosphate-sugar epimerase